MGEVSWHVHSHLPCHTGEAKASSHPSSLPFLAIQLIPSRLRMARPSSHPPFLLGCEERPGRHIWYMFGHGDTEPHLPTTQSVTGWVAGGGGVCVCIGERACVCMSVFTSTCRGLLE
jgi:hypothetical protein